MHLVSKIGFDTAKNGPSKISQEPANFEVQRAPAPAQDAPPGAAADAPLRPPPGLPSPPGAEGPARAHADFLSGPTAARLQRPQKRH